MRTGARDPLIPESGNNTSMDYHPINGVGVGGRVRGGGGGR